MHTYKVPEIVNTLVNNSASFKNVCLTNVEHNCTFLVDQAKLKCIADLREDDSGLWKNNGVQCVIIAVRQGNVSIIAQRTIPAPYHCSTIVAALSEKSKQPLWSMGNIYQLTCTYFTHHACPDFRKIIFTLCGKP